MQKVMAEDDPYKLDAKQFGSAMSQIAHGQAVMAAVRDYKKEMEKDSKLAGSAGQNQAFDVNELMEDDVELRKLHEDRIASLQEEHEKRARKVQQGHGTITDIQEGEFLEIVTKTDKCVVHFYHRDFERCKIMDKHLTLLARKFFDTRFIKVSAQDSPFFTVKLNIKMLPCVVLFKNGITVDRVVGFDGLGGTDDFDTDALEGRLLEAGVVVPAKVDRDEMEDRGADAPGKTLRRGFHNYQKTASDEDSDFD